MHQPCAVPVCCCSTARLLVPVPSECRGGSAGGTVPERALQEKQLVAASMPKVEALLAIFINMKRAELGQQVLEEFSAQIAALSAAIRKIKGADFEYTTETLRVELSGPCLVEGWLCTGLATARGGGFYANRCPDEVHLDPWMAELPGGRGALAALRRALASAADR